MHLYEWYGNSHQRHFVVAKSYADAEKAIKAEYGWTTDPKSIQDLGSYVLVAKHVLATKQEEE